METDPASRRLLRGRRAWIAGVAPGLAASAVIAVVGTGFEKVLPVLGSALPALLIGGLIAVVRRPAAAWAPGIRFASKYVLQFAVVLLGARLSLGEIADVGVTSLPVMLTTLIACLVTAFILGRLMGVGRDLRTLIGVGTGICGASAIAAVAPVIGASAVDIAYAVATIFLFNVLAVFMFPFLGHLIGLGQHDFGLFAGTAVNDTSSVVAVAAIYGSSALSFAIVVKLVRTLMIIPISVGLAVLTARRRERELSAGRSNRGDSGTQGMSPRRVVRLIPWFLVGFIGMSLLRTAGLFSHAVQGALSSTSVFLIAVAMAAIGLSTDLRAFRTAGIKPLLLGALLWIVVSATALTTILLMR